MVLLVLDVGMVAVLGWLIISTGNQCDDTRQDNADDGFSVHDYAGLSQVYLEDKPGNVSHNNMFRDVCFNMLPNDQKI
jgi:hypothetical protein